MSSPDRQEAIAEACGILNDADLPNVYALTKALHELAQQYRTVDEFARMSTRYTAAVAMVEKIRPHLPANI